MELTQLGQPFIWDNAIQLKNYRIHQLGHDAPSYGDFTATIGDRTNYLSANLFLEKKFRQCKKL